MTAAEVARCLESGGVALLPTDTVYGLAADAESERAVRRLYEIKGRAADRPAAVMFFALDDVLAALPELGGATRATLARLLPGPLTLVVANPGGRFPLAAAGGDTHRVGVRVPALTGALAPLRELRRPVLQSSANPSGGSDPRSLDSVAPQIRAGVDAELDGGTLPGTPSTVVDVAGLDTGRDPEVLREGAVPAADVLAALRRDP